MSEADTQFEKGWQSGYAENAAENARLQEDLAIVEHDLGIAKELLRSEHFGRDCSKYLVIPCQVCKFLNPDNYPESEAT